MNRSSALLAFSALSTVALCATLVSGQTHTALARVPGGTVHKGVLEEEDGKLIYSFEIKVPGKSGIEEVNVDAKSATAAAAKRPAAPGRTGR